MNGEYLGGVVRALLSAVGGYFVGKGLIDAETVTQVAGAGAILVTAIWSIVTKNKPA